MNESSSDISAAINRIKQKNAELSTTSSEQQSFYDSENDNHFSDDPTPDIHSSATDSEIELSEPNDTMISMNSNDDISAFCTKFNKKVGVATTNLQEVLEIVDIILTDHYDTHEQESLLSTSDENQVHKLKNKLETYKNKNKELTKRLHESENQCTNLQNSVDDLKSENHRLDDTLSSLQARLASAQHELEDTIQRNQRSKQTQNALEESIASLGDLIQAQLDDSTILTNQRDELVKIIYKQSNALEQYDQLLSQLQIDKLQTSKQDIVQPQEDENNYHTALAAICNSVSNILNEPQINNITQICESQEPALSKITDITNYLATQIKESSNVIQNSEESQEEIHDELLQMRDRCLRILGLFHEEIQFLQKLAHSNDIQDCIFYRQNQSQTLYLDSSAKEELIRHCARVGRYIEETIPQLNIEEFDNAFSRFEDIDASEVFSLMNPNNMQQKLKSFLDRIDIKDNILLNELTALFAAQAFMNDLLQNHAVELRMRFDLLQHETNKLRNDLIGDEEQIKTAKKLVHRFKRREEKIRKAFSTHFDVNEETDLVKLTYEFANHIDTVHDNTPELQVMQQKIQEITSTYEDMEKDLRHQLNQLQKEYKQIEQENKDQQQQFEQAILDKGQEIENKNEEINQLNQRLAHAQAQIEEINKQMEENKEGHCMELKSVEETSNNIINDMQNQINNLASESEELKIKIAQATALIEKHKKDKKEAKNRVEYLESVNLKSVASLKEKSQQLRDQYEEILQQSQVQLQKAQQSLKETQEEARTYQSRSEQYFAELSSEKIAKKSLELKIKTLEDRFESQKQTLIVQYKAQSKAFESQCEMKYNNLIENQMKLMNQFIEQSNSQRGTRIILSDSYDFSDFLQAFSNELDRKYGAQSIYEETVADLLKVQRLLKLQEGQEIYGPILKLVEEVKNSKKESKSAEAALEESHQKIINWQKELAKVEGELAALRQWETWARRIHRVVHETSCSTYSNEQLRLSLEESLLASASDRSLLIKINSLREQKKALLNIDSDIIRHKIDIRPTWRSLISICVSTRRMQTMSGCIAINNSSASSLDLSSGSYCNSKRKRKVRDVEDQPSRTIPSPLFKHI